MEMTPERWEYTQQYCREVFGREDEILSRLRKEAAEAGLPEISISPDVGRLLMILTSMTRGRLAMEVGTLGGYSAIWLARGLQENGRLITIEIDEKHAAFARRQFERAGLQRRIELRRASALEELPRLSRELGQASLDVVFLDAVKEEYPEYWRIIRPMIAAGGLLICDNALGSSSFWIDDADHPSREGADRLNRLVAGDPEFEAVVLSQRQGVLVARRREGVNKVTS